MPHYKKYYSIPATPEEVYLALTNPLAIKLWTGEECTMCTEVGSEFSLWNESICGKNLEFVPHAKIVQEWYFGEQENASIVTIKLHPDKKGTSLELSHTYIPEEAFDDITEGWNSSYIGALTLFFDETQD